MISHHPGNVGRIAAGFVWVSFSIASIQGKAASKLVHAKRLLLIANGAANDADCIIPKKFIGGVGSYGVAGFSNAVSGKRRRSLLAYNPCISRYWKIRFIPSL